MAYDPNNPFARILRGEIPCIRLFEDEHTLAFMDIMPQADGHALIVPKVIGRSDEARVVAAKQDIATLMQALKLYRLDNQRYPGNEQGLNALITRPTVAPVPPNWKTGGYLDRLPRDPWGNLYQYLAPGLHGEVDVFSLGADGQPGGSGLDADVGSWEQ